MAFVKKTKKQLTAQPMANINRVKLSSHVADWHFDNLRKILQTDLPILGKSSYPAITVPCFGQPDQYVYFITGSDQTMDGMIQQLDPHMEKVVICDNEEAMMYSFPGENIEFDVDLLHSIIRLMILFVNTTKVRPGDTYWLYKDGQVARVYNLTSLTCYEEIRQPQTSPYIGPVAGLFCHISKRLCQRRNEGLLNFKDRYKHICIMSNCVRLFDLGMQQYASPNLFRDALYLFAMWVMVEGSILHRGILPSPVNSENNEKESQLKVSTKTRSVLKQMPLGQVLKNYISFREKNKQTIMRSRAAPTFAHIPLALDLCFRGLEISCWQFDQLPDMHSFDVYVMKRPIVLKLVNMSRMVCTSLAQQHYQQRELAEAMCYVHIGLLNQEVLEAVELYKKIVTKKEEGTKSKDLFLRLLLAQAGEIHYTLSKRLEKDEAVVTSFKEKYDGFLANHDRYTGVMRHMNPRSGSRYSWVTKVCNRRKQLFLTSGRCFSAGLEQIYTPANDKEKASLVRLNRDLKWISNEPPMSADIKTLHNNFTLIRGKAMVNSSKAGSGVGSEQCKISSPSFTLKPKKADFLVDVMDPWIFLTTENDLMTSLDCEEDFRQTFEVLEAALKSYAQAKNDDKEMLIYAKLAMTSRVNAQWLKADNARIFSSREEELLVKAIHYYQRGLDKCKLEEGASKKEEQQQHDTMRWNMGDTYYQLANRLLNNIQQTTASGASEMERDMFAHLTKSIDVWLYFTESLDDSSCGKLKVARNRIAESHHMLACQHNQAYLEKGANHRNDNFRRAIEHYQLAAKYFSLAAMPTAEFFSRVGILNLLASQFTNNKTEEVAMLDDCLGDVYACLPCLEEIVTNLTRVSLQPNNDVSQHEEIDDGSDENLLYSANFCQNLHSWFSIFSYIITTIFKHSVHCNPPQSPSRKHFKEAYDRVLRVLQQADLLAIQGGHALRSDISTSALLTKARALVAAIRHTPPKIGQPGGK